MKKNTIYHLAYTPINGGVRDETEHSYYGSLKALWEDNASILQVSIYLLQRVSFPYTRKSHWDEWTIRKGRVYTTGDVRKYNKGLEKIKP